MKRVKAPHIELYFFLLRNVIEPYNKRANYWRRLSIETFGREKASIDIIKDHPRFPFKRKKVIEIKYPYSLENVIVLDPQYENVGKEIRNSMKKFYSIRQKEINPNLTKNLI